MQTRMLGATGLEVSILGLGGFHLVEISTSDVRSIVDRYLEAGGTYLETAAQYGDGESERKLGLALDGRRDRCVLATKTLGRDRAGADHELERSLRLLRTDRVDILFMHSIQRPEDLDRILEPDGGLRAAEAARQAGQVRFIGISNHGHPEILIEALRRYPFDVVMTTVNYYDHCNFPKIEAELLPLATEKRVGVVGMKAVGDGFLWRSADQAFRYAWSLPIHVMAAGTNTLALLEQDLGYAERFCPMAEDEKEQLLADAPELGRYVCRQCGLCLPCPVGIDIPRVFELEGWFDRQMWDGVVRDPGDYLMRYTLRSWFGNEERARRAYDAQPVQATACTDCGDCEPRCPYGLGITRKLRHAHHKLAVGEGSF